MLQYLFLYIKGDRREYLTVFKAWIPEEHLNQHSIIVEEFWSKQVYKSVSTVSITLHIYDKLYRNMRICLSLDVTE